VPGHRNIEGNCIADELASQGTIADILRDKDPVGMPMASSLGRDCTPSPTTDRTQPQHATIPGSLGQTTTKKNQTLLQCNREDISTQQLPQL